jgi:hypothetical protein
MLNRLARMLGVPERAAEDAIKSEKLARQYLTRRQALGGLAALVAGKAFGFPVTPMEDPRALMAAVAKRMIAFDFETMRYARRWDTGGLFTEAYIIERVST